MNELKIIYKDIKDIRPYPNNPRDNAPGVDAVAASIREFGFKVPIIIDKKDEIVAGHTRIMAAEQLGLKKVPCIIADDLPPSYKRNGIKDIFCEDCGMEVTVRKDAGTKYCKRCASARGGRGNKGLRTAPRKKCIGCGKSMLASDKSKYCSLDCRRKHIFVKRICKHCGKEFKIYKSSISGKTNAAGNFCSRLCYEDWLCDTERINGRGSRWKKVRAKAVKDTPFCICCGTTERLEGHHIVPYRLTRDNSQSNIAILCKSCHKKIESITLDVLAADSNCKRVRMILSNIFDTNRNAMLLAHARKAEPVVWGDLH